MKDLFKFSKFLKNSKKHINIPIRIKFFLVYKTRKYAERRIRTPVGTKPIGVFKS